MSRLRPNCTLGAERPTVQRQMLLDRQDLARTDVAIPVDPFEHVTRREREVEGCRCAGLDLVPRDRRRHGRCRGGPASEYGAIVVLWYAFWLQSTKILPGRSALAITVVTRPGIWRSSSCPTANAKSAAPSWVTPGRVQRYVHLQALRARGLAPAAADRPIRARREWRARCRSTRRWSQALPDRSRTRAHAARPVRRPTPSARGVRAPPCSPPTPSPPSRRSGSTRCRLCGHPGQAPHRPTAAGDRGTASRRILVCPIHPGSGERSTPGR